MSETLLDNFWLRMGSMFGHTWTSAYGTKPDGLAGDTWSAALADLSGPHIAEGLRAVLLLGSDFPPSAPRFRSLCFGIPSLSVVRREITVGNASPFARLVWSKLDTYRYRNSEAGKSDRLLKDAYDEALEHVMRGGDLVGHAEALAHEVEQRTPATEETAQASIAAAQKALEGDA